MQSEALCRARGRALLCDKVTGRFSLTCYDHEILSLVQRNKTIKKTGKSSLTHGRNQQIEREGEKNNSQIIEILPST